MPTNWKRSPEELHKIYIANTEAFYKTAGRSLVSPLDGFIRGCALAMWSHAGGITQNHVDAFNALYSRGSASPKWLLWQLTEEVCKAAEFMPPIFFWELAERDAKHRTDTSRVFIRMMSNILLYLAAVDDDVTWEEATYITNCTQKLAAICDSSGVPPSKPALNAQDYVTSGEPSFLDRYAGQASSAAAPVSKTPRQPGSFPKNPQRNYWRN